MYGCEVNRELHTFGVSGKLIMNALMMYDHQTRTLGSQFLLVFFEDSTGTALVYDRSVDDTALTFEVEGASSVTRTVLVDVETGTR